MSVLIAYGTQNYATFMSDSRATRYEDAQKSKFVGYYEETKKIYKITDQFMIGSAGDGSIHSWIKDVRPQDPNSMFHNMKDYSYDEFLRFFIKRFSISKSLKEKYCTIITAGINSQNKITMDIMFTSDLTPVTVQPSGDEISSRIFLPPNIPDSYVSQFSERLRYQQNKELYCENVIRDIADHDSSVNKIVQKITIHK